MTNRKSESVAARRALVPLFLILCVLAAIPCLAADTGNDDTEFGGIRFGVGLSITIDFGSDSRVESAEIIDGRVRVTEDRNVIPRVLLETHYFFPATTKRFLWIKEPGTWAWGPFVGLQSSDSEVIDAFAVGLMVGFRRTAEGVSEQADKVRGAKSALRSDDSRKTRSTLTSERETLKSMADAAGKSSFNIGIGLIVDPRSKVLGDGFVENEAPPGSETTVRFRTTDQWGAVLMFSFSF